MILTSSEPIMLLHAHADGCEDSRWRETKDDNEGEDDEDDQEEASAAAVSYTHLTMPTILLV